MTTSVSLSYYIYAILFLLVIIHLIATLVQDLGIEFDMKDLGKLNYFINLHIFQTNSVMHSYASTKICYKFVKA